MFLICFKRSFKNKTLKKVKGTHNVFIFLSNKFAYIILYCITLHYIYIYNDLFQNLLQGRGDRSLSRDNGCETRAKHGWSLTHLVAHTLRETHSVSHPTEHGTSRKNPTPAWGENINSTQNGPTTNPGTFTLCVYCNDYTPRREPGAPPTGQSNST